MSEQKDILAELLKSLREKDSDNEEEKIYGEEHLAQLRTACDNFLRKDKFEVGQIVKWKKDLQNRKLPHKNQPAIVVSILEEPIVNTDSQPGSPYFLERLDIVLGVMSNDGTFIILYYDSSRFEAY